MRLSFALEGSIGVPVQQINAYTSTIRVRRVDSDPSVLILSYESTVWRLDMLRFKFYGQNVHPNTDLYGVEEIYEMILAIIFILSSKINGTPPANQAT